MISNIAQNRLEQQNITMLSVDQENEHIWSPRTIQQQEKAKLGCRETR